eukprot:501641-Pyramimonas_sp.AAC.1
MSCVFSDMVAADSPTGMPKGTAQTEGDQSEFTPSVHACAINVCGDVELQRVIRQRLQHAASVASALEASL